MGRPRLTPTTRTPKTASPIPAYVVGKGDAYHAKAFMDDVAGRMKNEVQISTDALSTYVDAVSVRLART